MADFHRENIIVVGAMFNIEDTDLKVSILGKNVIDHKADNLPAKEVNHIIVWALTATIEAVDMK